MSSPDYDMLLQAEKLAGGVKFSNFKLIECSRNPVRPTSYLHWRIKFHLTFGSAHCSARKQL